MQKLDTLGFIQSQGINCIFGSQILKVTLFLNLGLKFKVFPMPLSCPPERADNSSPLTHSTTPALASSQGGHHWVARMPSAAAALTLCLPSLFSSMVLVCPSRVAGPAV